jgi:RNA recognition motif-containing protein
VSAQIINDRDTGRSKGFGFVEMSNDDEAQAAITALNGQQHNGRALTVNEARPREDRGGGGGGGGRGGFGGGGGGGRGGFGGGGGGGVVAAASVAAAVVAATAADAIATKRPIFALSLTIEAPATRVAGVLFASTSFEPTTERELTSRILSDS